MFINVPFDRRYKKLFDALVFAVHDCGFLARSAREQDDGSQVRLDKLYEIIGDCQFGIHDLSRTSLDTKYGLPRFNMPLELGIFLGAKKYGGAQQARKTCLILDREPFRYQIFCSDIAGQDIRAHYNDVSEAIAAVRNWLRTNRPSCLIPGAGRMQERYLEFRLDLPAVARAASLAIQELNFLDYRTLVTGWLDENSW
ncbi:MAG: hypothetical protein ABSH32_19030 [Bryobacteraceae bacterium]